MAVNWLHPPIQCVIKIPKRQIPETNRIHCIIGNRAWLNNSIPICATNTMRNQNSKKANTTTHTLLPQTNRIHSKITKPKLDSKIPFWYVQNSLMISILKIQMNFSNFISCCCVLDWLFHGTAHIWNLTPSLLLWWHIQLMPWTNDFVGEFVNQPHKRNSTHTSQPVWTNK